VVTNKSFHSVSKKKEKLTQSISSLICPVLLQSLEERFPDGNVTFASRPPLGPWIVTIDNFLKEDEMDALLDNAGDLKRSTDQGTVGEDGFQEQVVSSSRTSENAWCNQEVGCLACPSCSFSFFLFSCHACQWNPSMLACWVGSIICDTPSSSFCVHAKPHMCADSLFSHFLRTTAHRPYFCVLQLSAKTTRWLRGQPRACKS
jgi:hypothetical protein